jgi:hypothetical protein
MKYFILFAFVFLFAACENEVIVDLPEYKSKLVVNGLIDNVNPIRVQVGNSVAALSKDNPILFSQALVYLSANNQVVDTLQFDAFDNVYKSKITPQLNTEYQIAVRYAGYTDIFAKSRLIDGVLLESITYKDSSGVDENGFPTGTLRIVFADPAGVSNRYRFNLYYYNSNFQQFQPTSYETSDLSLNDEDNVSENDGSIIFNDLLFNGKRKEIEVTVSSLNTSSSPKLVVVFSALSEDYYRYALSLQKYRDADGNFFGEPVFIYSNVTNGLGIFASQLNLSDTIR